MASGSRGRGYRPRSLRMRAGGAPPDDDDDVALPVPDPRLANLPAADLLARLRRLLGTSGSGDAGAPVLAELERRLDEAEDRHRAADEVARTMRDRIKVLERSATAAHAESRRALETDARLRAEISVLKHKAAGAKASHQAALEALRTEAQSHRASGMEALLQNKIQELERKAAVVEANHRAETEALKRGAARAEADLSGEIIRRHKMAAHFQVHLGATINDAEYAAVKLEISHRLQIESLERRVTELEFNLGDEIGHRDRMARDFQDRLEAIASEGARVAAGVEAGHRAQVAALQRILAETRERLSDAISRRKGMASSVSAAGECATTEDDDVVASLRRGIEADDEPWIVELRGRVAKARAMNATENHDTDGQQGAPSPLRGGSPAQSSEHRDIVDLTTGEDA
jgi:hypothetical protein